MLTRSLREPGGPCTKFMEVSESNMERVNNWLIISFKLFAIFTFYLGGGVEYLQSLNFILPYVMILFCGFFVAI